MHAQSGSVKGVTFHTLTPSFLQLGVFWIYLYDAEGKREIENADLEEEEGGKKKKTTNTHVKNKNCYKARFWRQPVGMISCT